MSVKVTDFTVKSLAPTGIALSYPHLKHLAPQYPASRFGFTVSGVSNAIANAIRTCAGGELVTKCLDIIDFSDIQTTDPYHLHELLQSRVRCIPIQQTAKVGDTITLKSTNDTTEQVKVYTKDFHNAKSLMNTNIPLCTLEGGKALTIECKVVEAMGFTRGYGGCVPCVNAVCLPVDIEPFDIATGVGVPAANADPKIWRLEFTVNGNDQPKKIILRSIENLIERLNALKNILHSLNSRDDNHTLRVEDESHSIALMVTRGVFDLYPKIPCDNYNADSIGRAVTLRFRFDGTSDEVRSMITKSIAYNIKILEEIGAKL